MKLLLIAFFAASSCSANIDSEVHRLADETVHGATDEAKIAAVNQLAAIGEAACPELRRMLKSAEWLDRSKALNGVVALGPKASVLVPDIVAVLRDDKSFLRSRAADVLGHIGPTAESASPELVRLATSEDLPARLSAIYALPRIGKRSDAAIPVLVKNLDSGDDFPKGRLTKLYSAAALGSFGVASRSAVPALQKLANTSKFKDIASAAHEALDQIGGQDNPDRGYAAREFAANNNGLSGNVKPVRGWQGRHSLVWEESVQRITSRADWSALWTKLGRQPEDLPTVDFRKKMVIAIFQGQSGNTDDLRIISVTATDQELQLEYQFMASDAYTLPGDTQFLVVEVPKRKTVRVTKAWRIAMTDGRRHAQEMAVVGESQ